MFFDISIYVYFFVQKENKKYEVEPMTSIMYYIDPRIGIAW